MSDTGAAIDPSVFYRSGQARHQEDHARARREYDRLSHLRLLTFLATAGIGLGAAFQGHLAAAGFVALAGVAIFTWLAVRHDRVAERLGLSSRLAGINAEGLARLDGSWKDRRERGDEFADAGHPYSGDLDIFGQASLFQLINCAETGIGRRSLARSLSGSGESPEDIGRRQEMIRELAGRADWRQDFQAAGREVPRDTEDSESLIGWAESREGIRFSASQALLLRAWGILGPLGVVAGFFSPFPFALFLPILINASLIAATQGSARSIIAVLCRQKRSIEAYQGMLQRIESGGFRSGGLRAAASGLSSGEGVASREIRRLQAIADWLDIRLNPLIHVVLNSAFLWDLQWLLAFQAWKGRCGSSLRRWLECLGDFESLASLSVLPFEHPDWVFPEVSGSRSLRARGLGHPLLPAAEGVRNDFSLGESERIVILTGSNMTGKSTHLRTVGINLVLAYAGAPACAARFEAGLFRVHTSMRLKDDLDKGVSSFYAELLRIKSLLEACRNRKDTLFLIDEIFRGTNSADRIAGASELLLQLSRLEAIGIVTTHDLELGRLEGEHPGVFRNFHFTETFAGGEIRFDFRIRPGVATTRNARHLMRLAGIVSPITDL